jgi:hypothetical protein
VLLLATCADVSGLAAMGRDGMPASIILTEGRVGGNRTVLVAREGVVGRPAEMTRAGVSTSALFPGVVTSPIGGPAIRTTLARLASLRGRSRTGRRHARAN